MKSVRVILSLTWVVALSFPAALQEPAQEKPPAAEKPQDAASPQDGMSEKAKAAQDVYAEELRQARQEVTIVAENMKPLDVIKMFREKTEWNILFDGRNFPEDYVVDEFVVHDVPARLALDAFAEKIEATVEVLSPTLLRLSRPPRLTFNFRDADVRMVIDMIARVAGANIIIAPEVKGVITLSIKNVPWTAVLTNVVKTLGFTTVKEDFGIIRIIHPDELLKQMETRVFRLQYLAPKGAYSAQVEQNKQIFGQPVQPPTQIDQIIREFTVKRVLETVLSKDAGGQTVGSMEFDLESNAFVVTDTKVVLDRVDEIVKLLDVEPEQVLLDVKFISTTNEDLLVFGMNWGLGGQGGLTINNEILHPSSFTTPAGAEVFGKITKLPFGFGKEVGTPGDQFFLTQYNMSMTFRAFKQDRYSRLIQEPSILCLDNNASTIFVGETISYAETRATAGQLGQLEFSISEAGNSPIKVGFQLWVLPRVVRGSDKVILTVIPQNEFLTGQSPTAAVAGFERFTLVSQGLEQSIDLPRIATTNLLTKLIVQSGRTIILGGLVVERVTLEDQGLPVLKDLPLVNYLFKQRNDNLRKEHLLIFITPRIIKAGRGPQESLQRLLDTRMELERAEFDRIRQNAGQPK